ncbi:DUF1707 SHOCT-like domain-containing protein [Tenggerimyces flavus]|uniref:DUF1707 domain-containing protein n=1 Tax=Tenggerimyces flavus TaxID=1708749 RepID=A0ABV7YF70_9ACTN|nr:DUF1707 domain-containing protein [Tenggerimyces flavus]MBM7787204.1 hypothetical protein [Tenggerimyces flavus]
MLGDWAARPTIRARDVDREYAMGLLRNASVDGQLTTAEFEQRLGQAMRATTLGELASLIGDLQEQPAPVPVPVRQAPAPVAYVPAPPRRRGGLGRVLVGGLVLMLFLGGVSELRDGGDSGPAFDEYATNCFEDPNGENSPECVGTVFVNPLDLAGADPKAASYLERLGMPNALPIPTGAAFDGHNWQSASTDQATGEITHRWHLEYLVPDADQPIEPRHVADFYRDGVQLNRLGGRGYDERELPEGEGIELVWPGEGTGDQLAVRTSYTAKGSVRVLIDLTTVGPAQARADVAGELGDELRKTMFVTTVGMIYLQSRVTQLESNPTRCALEQVWSATPEQYAKIRTQLDGANVQLAELSNGKQLTYSASADCAALAF